MQFEKKGGVVSNSLDNTDLKVEEAKLKMEQMSQEMGFDFAIDPGVMQTLEATGGIRYTGGSQGDNVLIAYDKSGNIAGALSYTEKTFPNGKMDLFIEHAGSTGILDGTGSALTQKVFGIAASKNMSITLDAIPDARNFWTKMGFDNYFGGSLMNMTAQNVKAAIKK